MSTSTRSHMTPTAELNAGTETTTLTTHPGFQFSLFNFYYKKRIKDMISEDQHNMTTWLWNEMKYLVRIVSCTQKNLHALQSMFSYIISNVNSHGALLCLRHVFGLVVVIMHLLGINCSFSFTHTSAGCVWTSLQILNWMTCTPESIISLRDFKALWFLWWSS